MEKVWAPHTLKHSWVGLLWCIQRHFQLRSLCQWSWRWVQQARSWGPAPRLGLLPGSTNRRLSECKDNQIQEVWSRTPKQPKLTCFGLHNITATRQEFSTICVPDVLHFIYQMSQPTWPGVSMRTTTSADLIHHAGDNTFCLFLRCLVWKPFFIFVITTWVTIGFLSYSSN